MLAIVLLLLPPPMLSLLIMCYSIACNRVAVAVAYAIAADNVLLLAIVVEVLPRVFNDKFGSNT